MTREEAVVVARILSGLTDDAIRTLAGPGTRGTPDEHRASLAALFGMALDAARPTPPGPTLETVRGRIREALIAILNVVQTTAANVPAAAGEDPERHLGANRAFSEALDRAGAAISLI
jgi:hypothetical protein